MTAKLFNINRNIGKSQRISAIIETCIKNNHSIIIGTLWPDQRIIELQAEFPNAKFEICGQGVKLCVKSGV